MEVKNPYRLALANLNQPGYFPSLKLTKLIEEDLATPQGNGYAELKEPVKKVLEVYDGALARYV